jgi:hypothetical protein
MEKDDDRAALFLGVFRKKEVRQDIALRPLLIDVGRRILQNLPIACFANRCHSLQNTAHSSIPAALN